jgi:HEAT repeat protein
MFSLDAGSRDTIAKHFHRNKAFAWNEEFFLSQITSAASKYDVLWATIALRDCGSARSVPILKSLSTYPKQDVKCCAILTIAQVAGGAETPYYTECLLDPKYRSKTYALWAIGAVGDERALPAVVQFVRKNSKKLAEDTVDPREQQEILAYLHRIKAKDYLQEFGFLIAPLRRLTPVALNNFLQRVPEIRALMPPVA